MGKHAPEYTLEQIARIATKLDALPKIDKARFGKRDAIERLSKSILNVLKRGYSMDDIVASLREEGFHLTASTLRTYLHRTTAKPAKAKTDPPPGPKPREACPRAGGSSFPARIPTKFRGSPATPDVNPSRWRQDPLEDHSMAKPIYLVGGSKGGVGKSIVTMALIDSLQSLDETVFLVETDTTNPDVWMCYRDEVETATLDLDEADGWIALINRCESQPDHPVIINTAARNNHGVSVHGVTLDSTLAELQRPLVTFWVINRQRDSLELLKPFLDALPNATVHVVRNLYFGEPAKFELYNQSRLRGTLERAGGQTLDFPDLADRVSDDLFGRRLAIAKAARDLPLGNRAELTRWRHACARMFARILHDPANALRSA